jgi:hypothetical protein
MAAESQQLSCLKQSQLFLELDRTKAGDLLELTVKCGDAHRRLCRDSFYIDGFSIIFPNPLNGLTYAWSLAACKV